MEHAAKTLLEQIQINPVIAAVCNEDELKHALNSDCRVVFLLMGNVLDIGELTRRVHERKKLCVIHIDLIEGLSSKEIAVDAIQKATGAEGIYRSIGVYLAHALALYDQFYEIHHLLLLGRVVSGEGGKLIESACRETLKCDYPALAQKINLLLPDEESRRVGQSVAAASLPKS